MSFWQDFKSFAMKGSVIDLAVGVIIGGAFGKIVTALVDDVIMPLVGVITGKGQMFVDKFVVLKPAHADAESQSFTAAKKAGANVFAYGDFIKTIVNVLIIAFCIFLFIKLLSNMKKKQEAAAAAAPPVPSSTDTLLMEIRDELKKRGV